MSHIVLPEPISDNKAMTDLNRAIHGDEAFEHEARGAEAGLNPMFGEWGQVFNFAPISHQGSNGAAKQAFREAIHTELTNRFLFGHDVQLEIVLYLDLQTVLETDETADLDNYAKALLDTLKGARGILIDDTQVQSLSISWIDNNGPEDTKISVSAKSSPDDFMLKPVEFFEMPDGLYYPQSRRSWEDGGEEIDEKSRHAGLLILEMMSGTTKTMRHLLRQAGAQKLDAFRDARPLQTFARGFHRSRIDDSFTVCPYRDWKPATEAWLEDYPAEGALIMQSLDKMRTARDAVAEAFADQNRK